MALHLAWDKVDDYRDLAQFAEAGGIRIRSINPDLFSEDEYRLGSLTNEDPSVRRKTIEHLLHSIEVGKATHSEIQSLWFGDGTNFPAQGDFRRRKHWLLEGLRTVYDALPSEMYLMLEYKLFEPAFYHTDIADWGMAFTLCTHLGERAKVLVDLGHHALGTNIEHIVAFLIDENRLGGFHLNGKKHADDDLIAGSINPYELFLIYVEIAAAEADLDMQGKIGFMLDQSHNADALLCTRGVLRNCVDAASSVPIILRVSGGASIVGKDLAHETITTSIEEIVRLNASAVGVSVFIGTEYEHETLRNLSQLVNQCEDFGIPVMAVTAVGRDLEKRDARYLGLCSRICAELGARVVKTYWCKDFDKVVQGCPVPVVIAGGPICETELEVLEFVYDGMQRGAIGINLGRNVWKHAHPVPMMRALRAIIHDNATPKEALQVFENLRAASG